MTGTGTQNDPYIVDTWEDFVTAAGTSGAYVKVADDTVWDMNSIAPEGIGRIYCTCAELDGNGAIIKNLHTTSDMLLNVTNVHDLTIENFYMNYSGSENPKIVYLRAGDELVRCTLSGIVAASRGCYFWYRIHQSAEIRQCSFNVKYDIGDSYVTFDDTSRGNYNEFNHICLDLANANLSTSTSIGTQNSLIEIKRKSGDTNKFPSGYSNSTIIRYDVGTANEVNQVRNTSGTLTEVTDTQLKDAAYLASIGFPIGVD